jgi:hypothetical protein
MLRLVNEYDYYVCYLDYEIEQPDGEIKGSTDCKVESITIAFIDKMETVDFRPKII